MIDAATLTAIVGIVSVAATVGTTMWHKRTEGPEAASRMVTASTLMLAQLQDRIEVLESRVGRLESENTAYYRLYGPLPRGGEHPERP